MEFIILEFAIYAYHEGDISVNGNLEIDRIFDELNRIAEESNCNILTKLLVADILAPEEEFDLDEDDYYDLTYLIIEDDLVPALINGKSIFLTSS